MIRDLSIAALILVTCGAPARAQSVPDGETGPAAASGGTTPQAAPDAQPAGAAGTEGSAAAENGAAQDEERDDAVLDRAQPDFTLVNLPTTLRLPQWKSSFRVTHRFTRPLGRGDFGNLVEDLFGLDSGAVIGLEYRMGILPGTQVGVYRTNDRTIELFSQYDLRQQSASFPVSLAVFGSIDGTNNFRDRYSPAIGLLVSRKIGDRLAVYGEPFWVNNTNQLPSELVDDNDTVIVGLGARLRVSRNVYLVGEAVPRASGFKPGVTAASFAIERRAGGHAFQLVFSNSFGLTMAQIARGGLRREDWYLGFGISRKFF